MSSFWPVRSGLATDILNAAAATGPSGSYPAAGIRFWGLQVTATGTPTTVVVTLEGSNDNGTTWFTIGTWTRASQAFGDIVFVSDKPVNSIRANLTSLGGGTAPTVSAYLSGL